MNPAFLFAAKSTVDEKGSIEAQLAQGRALAENLGLQVVGEFQDEDISAYSANRGGDLARAMAECERLAPCTLIVQHSDRLARGDGIVVRDVAYYSQWAKQHKVTVLSMQDPWAFADYGNPHIEKLLAVIAGMRNNEDSKRKGASVKDGLRRRAERGQSRGGPRPYGYQRGYRLSEKGERQGFYVIDPAEAAVVRRIFDSYLSGQTVRALAYDLTVEKVPAVHGSSWPQATIKRILSRKLYIGIVEDADGNEHRGEHDAIITPEVFARATAIRKSQARRVGGRRAHGSHLLVRGVLKCGKCDSTLHPRAAKDIYYCGGRLQWGVEYCDQSALSREAIDSALMGALKREFIDWDETQRQNDERNSVALAMARQQIKVTQDELAKVELRSPKPSATMTKVKSAVGRWNV